MHKSHPKNRHKAVRKETGLTNHDESNIYRTVIKIEKILINSGLFNLLGKKELNQSKNEIEKITVDVSEHEVERQKKSKKVIIVGNKNSIQ